MTDSKLTYLKPPPPSGCYRGCREGCECEQPERVTGEWTPWPGRDDVRLFSSAATPIPADWTRFRAAMPAAQPERASPADLVDCLQDQVHKQSTVHRAGKSARQYTGKAKWGEVTTTVLLVHHEGRGGAMACGLKDLDGCMYCSSDDLGDVTCPQCLSQALPVGGVGKVPASPTLRDHSCGDSLTERIPGVSLCSVCCPETDLTP